MAQPELTRFKQLRITTVIDDPPSDTPSTPPQFTLSPRDPGDVATTGVLFMYNIPPGSSASPPFVFTPYVRDPITGYWGRCAPTPALADRRLWGFEFDASEISIIATSSGADGEIIMMIAEQ